MADKSTARIATARIQYPALLLFTLLAGDAWRYMIGWIGWAILVAVLAVIAMVMLVRRRASWTVGSLPYPLIAFVVLGFLSTAWSFYPGATVLGAVITLATTAAGLAVAVSYSWRELLAALGIALRFALGLSILFELYVSLIIRGPILPLVPEPGIDYSTFSASNPVPLMLYWSRDELFQVFSGGKIQGILGNSVLLAFGALLGIIVFALQLAARTTRKRVGIPWLVLAVLLLAFTRSATVILALVVVVVVALAVVVVRRTSDARGRAITYGVIAAVMVVLGVLAVLFQKTWLALLGKSEDFTGRTDIWATVIHLAQQRPVQGWGWVGYWNPFVAPFDTLVFRNGVRQLHAHDAWIDVWFQLGIIGLIVFGALIISSLVRSWTYALDRPQFAPGSPRPYTAESLLPLLVLVALVVQSVAESRILVEFGWLFLTVIAVKTKYGDRPETVDELVPASTR